MQISGWLGSALDMDILLSDLPITPLLVSGMRKGGLLVQGHWMVGRGGNASISSNYLISGPMICLPWLKTPRIFFSCLSRIRFCGTARSIKFIDSPIVSTF